MTARGAVTILSLLVGGAACSGDSFDPKSADLSGTVVSIQANTHRINVRSTKMAPSVDPTEFDYTLSVTGKVYVETAPGEYHEARFEDIPAPSLVLVWTTRAFFDSYPMQGVAERVVVVYTDLMARRTPTPP